MKVNKLIAKGLTLGLLLNSLSVLSYANAEIPNRYQTLEGEYITIDDSTEGNLEEIEIFGNTVQDENNLEDIQSVGDLYIDENGNPILDSQGRKQYKIKIISRNKNLFNEEWMLGKLDECWEGEFKKDDVSSSTDFIKVIPGQSYKFNKAVHVLLYDKNKEYLGVDEGYLGVITRNTSFNVGNAEYIRLYRYTDGRENAMLYYSEDNLENTEYIKMEEQVHNIIIPTQLQKVGDVADKLYWDNSKGRYIVEKKINIVREEIFFNSINTNLDEVYLIDVTKKNIFNNEFFKGVAGNKKNYLYLSDFTKIEHMYNQGLYEHFYLEGDKIRIYINKSRIDNIIGDDIVKKALTLIKNSFIMGVKSTAEIIETNITSKLTIPTYNEKTHVYVDSENGINPTLKITVDRLPQIAKNSIKEAEANSSVYNIALARMYTNMLPESLYKDQLQNQLSEIFSSDIVLDKKSASSNIDVYIKSENMLQMSLNTNSITFEDFSGVEDIIKENAVQISINSSLPYSLNAYLPTEIQNSDKSVIMNKDILNIKENSETAYQTFANITDKIVLKDNCPAGNDLVHGVDIKLKGGIAHQKDVYKTTIKLEAEQK